MPHTPNSVRAVFFDAVGTLLFPTPPALTIYAETAHRYGLKISDDDVRRRFIAAYRAEEEADVASGWITSEARERDRWQRIVAATLAGVVDAGACFRDLFNHFAQPAAWRVTADAATVLNTLHGRGYVLGLGSNYDERLWPVLAGFPELSLLHDRVVISATVGVRKPGSGFFHEVARAAGCGVSEVLFVGDDLTNDYSGATAAGMPAVLLDPHPRHPDVPHRVTRLAELIDGSSEQVISAS